MARRRRMLTVVVSPRGVAVLVAASLVCGVLALDVVASSHHRTAAANGRLRVVAGENQYGNLAAQLGGRLVTVQSLLQNPNVDPHSFEASPLVASEVASANVVIENGLGYDTFLAQLVAATPSRTRAVVVAQRVAGVSPTLDNPHLWYDVAAMTPVARAITRALITQLPGYRSYFVDRLRHVERALDGVQALTRAWRGRLQGRSVAVTEPVADDLVRALGVRVATPFRFQADVMNGVDPSPEGITAQENLLRGHHVGALLVNAQVIDPLTSALASLARQERVPVVAVYETMPHGFTYQSWMTAELNAIARALVDGQTKESL